MTVLPTETTTKSWVRTVTRFLSHYFKCKAYPREISVNEVKERKLRNEFSDKQIRRQIMDPEFKIDLPVLKEANICFP